MTTHNADDGWFSILRWGHCNAYPMPPRGPYRGRREALEALGRWRERAGSLAGTIEAAHSVRLAGPFATRAAARNADISDNA